jgi:hypothetical protein
VQDRDGQRGPEHEAASAARTSGSSSSAGSERPADRDGHDRQQAEHDQERQQLHDDDRRRDRLAREARLADQRALVEQRGRRLLQRLAEEDPHDQPAQQEQGVVGDVERLEHDVEQEPVRRHQHERVDQVPRHPERRALVLLAQLTPDELLEEEARGPGHRPRTLAARL